MANITFTDQNFNEQVRQSKLPVVVDFWAPWCPPCVAINPIIETLAKEYAGKVVIGKMNADENPQTIAHLSIMSMPTVMLFKQDKPMKAMIGLQGKATYKAAIDEVLAS